jgi:N-acetylneuraminic acid mutarotase
VNGANLTNQQGTYGTQGTAAPSNVPGSRYGAVSWTDSAGAFWLFSGFGPASGGLNLYGSFNDLWMYSAGQWTWIGGSNLVNQSGTYGTQGTAAPGNVPGARLSAASATDAARNLWLFGGIGYDRNGSASALNDLWKYSSGQWTWMSGSNLVGQQGIYGTQGMASPSNVPGARQGVASWTDAVGAYWLFGGYGLDSAGTLGDLNDLWKYSSGEWTWVGGSNLANQSGTYGTQGIAASNNLPGARSAPVLWADAAGNLWLFGGNGVDSAANEGYLNDLWKYSMGQWTWMGGSNLINQQGTYGTQGIAASGNIPGARTTAVGWTDAAGNFWLFGGQGYSAGQGGALNDLWKYSAGQWTWMGGSTSADELGTYGTQGTAASSNIPGARDLAVSWIDASGNLWLLGGNGYPASGLSGDLNDLWEFKP